MSGQPNLKHVTANGANKIMGTTASPVHKMSLNEVREAYQKFHTEKAQEADALSKNAKKDAKKLGVASLLVAGGAALLGASAGLAVVAAAPLLLMGAHKMDVWLNKMEAKDIHETTIRNDQHIEITKFAKDNNIEIDQKKTVQEDRARSNKGQMRVVKKPSLS